MEQMQEIMDVIDGMLAAAESDQDTAQAEALAGLAETVSACIDANPDSAECAAVADAVLALLQTMVTDEPADAETETDAPDAAQGE